MSNDQEAQKDEILALESIFGDFFSPFEAKDLGCSNTLDDVKNNQGGELKIVIEISSPFYICYHNHITKEEEKHNIEHLPPVYLHFSFPDEYPSQLPPEYTLSCKWIDRKQLSLICKKLDLMWESNIGSEVIFTWAQYIKEETFHLIGLTDSLIVLNTRLKRLKSNDGCSVGSSGNSTCASGCEKNVEDVSGISGHSLVMRSRSNSDDLDPRAVQDIGPNCCLVRILKDFDNEKRQKVFESKQFMCKVCFSDKSGSQCLEFWPCHHVYCKNCMKSYFEVQIKEGNFKYLKCPEVKCDSEANPKQVEGLVSDDLYTKWDSMLLNSTLSSLGDIQPCPRQHCQYPVTVEENQGHCPSCGFVFCGLCRFGYHGVEKCKFKTGEAKKVLDTYINGSEQERSQLEERFGKKYLSLLVEEFLSASYMEDNAKTCPRCRSNIEKVDGCNKMTCKQCGTNFCWLCEKYLDRMNPYNHFNNPTSDCFNMLFFGIRAEEHFQDEGLDQEIDDFFFD